MSSQRTPKRYSDPSYQAAHDDTYAHPLDSEIPEVLPPGVTRQEFDDAIDKCARVLGGNSTILVGRDRKEFIDPYDLPEEGCEKRIPSAAICLGSIDDLRAVLDIFNRASIPVWTVSRGKNLGYGGPAPVVSGSVVLDLHRINRIIEVNEKMAYAVVEPGVTFTDLYDYCVTHKLKVWPSTASLGWGSVIGNTLDRGMGFMPKGMHHHYIAGLEVVLANGDIVRTGQFANTKSPSAHLTTLSFGPTIDGLFLQSNLGIVTKMGIQLQRQPEAYMSCRLDMPKMDDLATIVDLMSELRQDSVLTFTYVYSVVMEASLYKQRHEWHANTDKPIPDWRLREIMNELNCGFWIARFSFMGPKHMIQAQYDEVARAVAAKAPTSRISQATFTGDQQTGGRVDAASIPMPHGGHFVGVPSIEGLEVAKVLNTRAKARAPGAHAAYSPIVPLDGKFVLDWVKCVKSIYEKYGLDLLEDFYLNDKYAVSVCEMPWEKTDVAQRNKAARVMEELFDEGAKRGLTKYRSHINHMDAGAELFDFNNHAYRRFVETLKDALDPAGILSPGKQGIWPRRLRYLYSPGHSKL